MKRILFVSHESSRSGAPILLLRLLNWLKTNTNWVCDILFLDSKGDLISEFRNSLDSMYSWDGYRGKNAFYWIFNRFVEYTGIRKQGLMNTLKKNNYSLIYGNTAATVSVVSQLKDHLRCHAILHIHEMATTMKSMNGIDFSSLPNFDSIIAVSKLVEQNLLENYNIPTHKIHRIPGFVNVIPNSEEGDVREKLGIPRDAIVVGGCGNIGWCKGTDLFIQVARIVLDVVNIEVHFVWLGGNRESDGFKFVEADVLKLGLKGRIHLVERQSDPIPYFQAFDIFSLTSREDSFPLACLENGQLGNPVVCFEQATGSTEYIDNDMGHISPYLNIQDMANTIVEYSKNHKLIETHGNRLQNRTKYFLIENIAPKIVKLIEETLLW